MLSDVMWTGLTGILVIVFLSLLKRESGLGLAG